MSNVELLNAEQREWKVGLTSEVRYQRSAKKTELGHKRIFASRGNCGKRRVDENLGPIGHPS
jgi:hypothetical protein